MCGICGIMRLGVPEDRPDWSIVHSMTDALAHRGPDDRGVWCDRQIALGHRRLSVIDLSSAGHQPMGNEDGSLQITYNGEIYNFRDLKEQYRLVERGHQFRSRTDTEVLLHLYEERGLDMAPLLNGMFAFAIWDAGKGLLQLFRDPYGIKPLFYQSDGRFFRFGSEIKAILADSRVPRSASIQALHDFLTFDYIPGEQTAFEGIYEVPPGHVITVDVTGAVSMRRYHDLPWTADDSIDERRAIVRARDLMQQAVTRQLVADVPVGVLLSGGMDSSAIVAFMHAATTERIHTFSVGFEDGSFNELPYARIVAERFSTVAHEVVVTDRLVRELLPKYLTYIDEPYADGSAIPTYYLSQLARDHVVVVLSGEGGDEAFAGYDTYAAYKASQWFGRIPRWIRRSLIAPIVRALPVSEKKLSLEFKAKRFLAGQDLAPARAHLWWRMVLAESQKLQLYTPFALERLALQPSERHFIDAFERPLAKDALSRLMYVDAAVFLPDDLMVKNDRMSMAHSIEARVPLTDLELTAFMSTVPSRLKLPGLRKKHIMRRALEGILPQQILQKKKVGLEMPYSRWLKRELHDLLIAHLGPSIADLGLFRPERVQTLIDEHMHGRHDHGRALWGLLNYVMWHKLYVARTAS